MAWPGGIAADATFWTGPTDQRQPSTILLQASVNSNMRDPAAQVFEAALASLSRFLPPSVSISPSTPRLRIVSLNVSR